MHQIELEQNGLGPYVSRIQAVSQRCLVGEPVDRATGSYFGGMPTIDRPFEWPKKDGYPLNFVGQIQCSEFEFLPLEKGVMLFFYDNRHWGYSARDRGHAVVLHQQGLETATDSNLPEYMAPALFGLMKRRVKPKVYQHVDVAFHEGRSYPSLERNLLQFDDEAVDDRYLEFCSSVQPLVQMGGFPDPIQSDSMEADCINALNYGESKDWLLLLQLIEMGDMVWGDAGALYWFIHKDDARASRIDRVWMVSQCH